MAGGYLKPDELYIIGTNPKLHLDGVTAFSLRENAGHLEVYDEDSSTVKRAQLDVLKGIKKNASGSVSFASAGNRYTTSQLATTTTATTKTPATSITGVEANFAQAKAVFATSGSPTDIDGKVILKGGGSTVTGTFSNKTTTTTTGTTTLTIFGSTFTASFSPTVVAGGSIQNPQVSLALNEVTTIGTS